MHRLLTACQRSIVMPMYNLIEYSKNYSKTWGSYEINTEMNQIFPEQAA